ncbi:hypothetical protein [Natronococcus jeotgali]|uniref:Uncharacterized protein n=1 Tax=Natronococcus jeotgali DSM 18795 TaxID=1227498 RepID=L9XTA1_9EURY|nr:hypothetical protein [Natronococcus jeotgali]ELY64616.1 hypothetical protein C492_04930 [Natronococcus jeotgali DSM 18795]
MTSATVRVLSVAANGSSLWTAAFLVAFGLLASVLLHAWTDHTLETFGGDDASPQKTNCRACGARIAVEADRCPYCERSLDEDDAPDYGRVGT